VCQCYLQVRISHWVIARTHRAELKPFWGHWSSDRQDTPREVISLAPSSRYFWYLSL
jgi:elongation factor P hydroxylase